MTDKWIYQAVAALMVYEDIHAHPLDGGVCLEKILRIVPLDVKNVAKAMIESDLDDHYKYLLYDDEVEK